MQKREIAAKIAHQMGCTTCWVEEAIEAYSRIIVDALLEKGRFFIPGLGSLFVRQRGARVMHNPRSGKTVQVEAKKVVKFAPCTALKAIVNRQK